MAKAEIKRTETIVSLELNENEVKVVLGLMGCVGGSSDNTPRKYSDAIYDTLRNLFPQFNYGGFEILKDHKRDAVFFNNDTLEQFEGLKL